MRLEQPFIRLPFTFDAVRLTAELNALEDRMWRPHPSGMPGNTALPLISRNAADNDDFDGPMGATRHLNDSPYIRQCLHTIGEVYGRSRLMALEAGAEVSRHVDFNYHWYSRVRIHIPIVTNSDVVFYCGDQQVHMEAGSCWIFDSWRHHRVVNAGTLRRTHLVVDTAGSSRFWNTVDAAVEGRAVAPDEPLAYDADATAEVRTERFNTTPVLAPGELSALVCDLLDDLNDNASNPAEELRRFAGVLNDLVHDWRAVWSQYGYSRQGFPHYQRLLNEAAGRLPRQPRVLTTASNDVGATPIAMQRILRAALRPDLLDDVLGVS